ncbi:MAG: type II toxin-antitoxin system RelE/ParE family toxin [Candidatus Aquicultor sp.]
MYDIEFKTKKLERCYLVSQYGQRVLGPDIARKYIERINILRSIESLDDLNAFPQLRFHSLKGDREGQYAINLTGYVRLIFTLQGSEMQVICIEEMSKHYE